MGWAVNIGMGMPPGSKGQTMYVVAVDVCAKVVVPTAIEDRRAVTLANWLYTSVITEYGPPVFVRTDNGGEF